MMAVHVEAMDRDKEVAGTDAARVVGDPRDLHLGVAFEHRTSASGELVKPHVAENSRVMVAEIGGREFAWGSRTYVMGIVNVTPDSFSGDGVTDVKRAVAQAQAMERDGADLVDVGGESTRPETWSGPGLPAEQEAARVLPVIAALRGVPSGPISIGPFEAEVAAAAIGAGADLVNDVWGLRRYPKMAATVGAAGV